MKRTTKTALISALIVLALTFSALVGTTFAWFTDSVSSSGNKIEAGTLKLDLELLDKVTGWGSIKESKAAIFNYEKWEPGYVDVKVLKVENEGNLALKWKAMFICAEELTILADVIDVYVKPSETELAYPASRDIEAEGYVKVGTVKEFVNTIEETTYGTLLAGDVAYLGFALKMQESAGNEYQGLNLGAAFDIKILATQASYENDSFGDDYDASAEYEKVQLPAKKVKVTSATELTEALANVTDRELVIDAEGVKVTMSSADHFNISAGVTVKNLEITNTFRGLSYVMYDAGPGESVVFENCVFGNTNRILVLGGSANGASKVVYNNCVFKGQVLSNFVDNPDGVAEFNNCTFTKANTGSYHYIEAMGGTHNFNNCTFDYTGVAQNSMGVITSGQINVYSEDEYSTTVVLNGCTRINCGTRKYGSNSTLIVK